MRNSRLTYPAVFCMVLLTLGGLAESTTYWVAPPPQGSDANPGTSQAPWATLQHAADQVVAGDTVLVASGDYAGFQLSTSGTEGAPITFRSADGEAPRITADNPSTPDGLNLEGASWIVIEGFEVDGRSRAGIRAVLCEHVTIRGNSCDSNGTWGIFTGFCDDLLIEENATSRSGDEHGIYVSNSGDRPVIRNNLIWGNHANGIHMNGDASMGGDGLISDALVENNIIWDNGEGGGSGINMDGVQYSLVRNNLIFTTQASGISLYRIDGAEGSNNNRVLNNTVLVASDGRWALNIQDSSTGNVVRNNVFWSEHGYRGAMSVCAGCLTGFSSDHNAVEDRFTLDDGDSVMSLAEWRTATGQDVDSFVATPSELFESVAGNDYHLKEGSSAVDAGETRADVEADLENTPRPLGAGHDIGAFEGVGVLFVDGFESGDASTWSVTAPQRGHGPQPKAMAQRPAPAAARRLGPSSRAKTTVLRELSLGS